MCLLTLFSLATCILFRYIVQFFLTYSISLSILGLSSFQTSFVMFILVISSLFSVYKSQDAMLSNLFEFLSFRPYVHSGYRGYWKFCLAEHDSFGFLRQYLETSVFCPFDKSIHCFLYSDCGYTRWCRCVMGSSIPSVIPAITTSCTFPFSNRLSSAALSFLLRFLESFLSYR
jgi:hypothetical protein